tara:strand:- start:117 stop:566 length:450 start_codon:yes stop_codon:yes gene_type:complete
MKLNKIKTTLSIAELTNLKRNFKNFTIEKNFIDKKSAEIALSKTLTKVLAKNISLSKHLDPHVLKYPLTINFFDSSVNLMSHLRKDLNNKNNNIVFVNADNIALKENDLKKVSSVSTLSLFNNFNSIFSAAILVLKCIKISAANNTTKS